MTTASTIARLSEPKLLAWLLARMREENIDPPIDANRLESHEDFPRLVHDETRDRKLRVRLENATLAALHEVADGDLRGGADSRAVGHLAALADAIRLRNAVPILRRIAERGALGGIKGGLHPDAEQSVLLALASLQPRNTLWSEWQTLWGRDISHLWPIATVGLRFSAPERALTLLPEAIDRAMKHPEFPLGEVLWACATADGITDTDVATALAGISPAAQEQCRKALRALGAENAQIDAWLAGANRDLPQWACISSIKQVPRFSEGFACR